MGFYLSTIDHKPWKSQLLSQQEAVTGRRDWPALPLSGPILEAEQFRGRMLELYVSVEVWPNQGWAVYALRALNVSTAGAFGAGSPCSYGQDCRTFAGTPGGLATPNQEQHLWRWRMGSVVVGISAMGAPGWPVGHARPLLDYYVTTLTSTEETGDNDDAVTLPPDIPPWVPQ